MPQMGEFSLAIGRLSPADALGGAALGPILSIATAITSVLAPLTSRSSLPLSQWADRRSPAVLRRMLLAMQLGVDTFWSALSLKGETGAQLHNAGRRILIDIGIIVVLASAGTALLYATPAIIGDVLPVSQGVSGLILAGAVIGLSTPPAIGIWPENWGFRDTGEEIHRPGEPRQLLRHQHLTPAQARQWTLQCW